MRLPARRGLFGAAVLAAGWCATSMAWGDEIKLKDGKKLYGVIVGYEDNMFRVKTDFGFVLVEKDKIASIVPAGQTEKPAAAKVGGKTAESKEKDAASAANSPSDEPKKAKSPDAPANPSFPASQ